MMVAPWRGKTGQSNIPPYPFNWPRHWIQYRYCVALVDGWLTRLLSKNESEVNRFSTELHLGDCFFTSTDAAASATVVKLAHVIQRATDKQTDRERGVQFERSIDERWAKWMQTCFTLHCRLTMNGTQWYWRSTLPHCWSLFVSLLNYTNSVLLLNALCDKFTEVRQRWSARYSHFTFYCPDEHSPVDYGYYNSPMY